MSVWVGSFSSGSSGVTGFSNPHPSAMSAANEIAAKRFKSDFIFKVVFKIARKGTFYYVHIQIDLAIIINFRIIYLWDIKHIEDDAG